MVLRFDRAVHHILQQMDESDLDRPVEALSFGTAEDVLADAILGGYQQTVSGDSSTNLSDAFASMAAQNPSALALSCDGVSLTYSELDMLITAMANRLRRAGVSPGQRVGVCLERCLMVVPLFVAIVRSGATYVPIDPRSPPARQRYIAEDAGLARLVVQDGGIADCEVLVIPLEDLIGALDSDLDPDGINEGRHGHGSEEAAPAYIIYTSGSTGRPKGVLVGQKSILSLIHATSAEFGLGNTDRWTFFHSAAFDFATWEIWGCLLTGGHLVVVPYFVSRTPEKFLQLLREYRITVLNQTPTAFAQLMAVHRAEDADLSTRLVIFGGEPLNTRALLAWMDRYPESRCRLVNMFGITETTVHVTAETLTRHHALAGTSTVGAPIPGWSIHIKDNHGRHLPPGLIGEIYVGGAGLAVSYWRLPEETDARFAEDLVLGCRLYRSGDRGRLRPDGRLDHLGRVDTQIKLRGFRIELEEIRQILLGQPGVNAAMVTLRTIEDRSEGSYIEAFATSVDQSASELRRRLREILPEYMVPERLWVIDHFPLTANGKFDLVAASAMCDRVELDPSPASVRIRSEVRSPDAVETALARVWSEVFGRDVAPHENFFDLGGNSLTAVKLARAMQQSWSQIASIRDIYLHQTPQRLAAAFRDMSA